MREGGEDVPGSACRDQLDGGPDAVVDDRRYQVTVNDPQDRLQAGFPKRPVKATRPNSYVRTGMINKVLTSLAAHNKANKLPCNRVKIY